MATLYGRCSDAFMWDRCVQGRSRKYIVRQGLTARQFNATVYELKGKVRAARESQKHWMATLRRQIAATETAIGRLQK